MNRSAYKKVKNYFKKNIDTCPNSLRVLNTYHQWAPKELKENHEIVMNKIREKYGVAGSGGKTILDPLPNAAAAIARTDEKEGFASTLTISQEGYAKFYKELIKQLAEKLPISYLDPSPRWYYKILTGIGGVHFEWAFHGRPINSFGVELHFERGSKNFNSKAMEKLEPLREEIEKQTNEPVIFQKEWGRVWSRIYIEKSVGKIEEDLKKWAVEKMEIFYRLLGPQLERIKNEIL